MFLKILNELKQTKMKYKVSIEKEYFFVPSVLSKTQPEADSMKKALISYTKEIHELVNQEKKALNAETLGLKTNVEIIKDYKNIKNIQQVEKEVENILSEKECLILKEIILSSAEEMFEKSFGILNPEENPSIFEKWNDGAYHLTATAFSYFRDLCIEKTIEITSFLNTNLLPLRDRVLNDTDNRSKRRIVYLFDEPAPTVVEPIAERDVSPLVWRSSFNNYPQYIDPVTLTPATPESSTSDENLDNEDDEEDEPDPFFDIEHSLDAPSI
jgi:hypothetical protein